MCGTVYTITGNRGYLTLDLSESRALVSMKVLSFRSAHIVKVVPPLLEGFPHATKLHLRK